MSQQLRSDSLLSASSDHFAIHLVRALASLYVVFFHINEPIPYISNWWTDFCKLGWLGVPAFFMISGYCIGLLEERASPSRFLLSRLIRIYPAYWSSLALVLVVIFISKLTYGVNDIAVLPRDWQGVSAHFLLLLNPLTNAPSLSWVYWSLVVEIFFYLYFFCCLQVKVWRVGALLLPLLIYPWRDFSLMEVHILFWVDEYQFFLVGYFMQRLSRSRSSLDLLLLTLITIICCTTHKTEERVVVAVVIFLLIFLPIVGHKLANSVVNYFSSISYSLYLVHVPLACYLLLKLRDPWIVYGPVTHCLADMVLVFVTVVFAGYFCRFIEKPSHQWARSIFKG